MKKSVCFSILILFGITCLCFATEDGGNKSFFVGFLGDTNEYALVFTTDIYTLEPDNDHFSAMFSLLSLKSCNTTITETVEIEDNTGSLNNAFFSKNMELFFSYFKKKSKTISIKNYTLGKKSLLSTIEPLSKVKENKASFVEWKKSAKFKVDGEGILKISLIEQKKSNQKVFTPKADLNNSKSLGQSIVSNLNPEIIYYSGEYKPSDIIAYKSKSGSIVVVGAIADKPEFDGSFFPLTIALPYNNCK